MGSISQFIFVIGYALMRKIDIAKQLLTQHPDLFQCPLCKGPLQPNATYSLVCPNRHTFDLSKNGSVHLLAHAAKPSKYSEPMFEARQALCKSGFFDELIAHVAEIGRHHLRTSATEEMRVLDAGCGEGFHLAKLADLWGGRQHRHLLGVGIDIAKAGIRIAAREYPGLLWCVADLSRAPFRDNRFHLILNIFSPTNYAEMTRLLDDNGLLVKVVPGADYLIELRQRLYDRKDKQVYSNARIIERFREQCRMTACHQVRYAKTLSDRDMKHLLAMTPLLWDVPARVAEALLASNLRTVTVDAVILAGEKLRSPQSS